MKIRLNYKQKGRGKTLILLHGNGENNSYFAAQMDYFAKKYRVIALDTRGHGKSPRGEEPFTIRQFADDLADFMKEHSIKKASILGFSDGGNTALCFAAKYPELVDRLIVWGANLYPSGVKNIALIPIKILRKIVDLISKIDIRAKLPSEKLALVTNEPYISETELENIHARTLILGGTHDIIKTEHTRLISRCIPKAKLCLIPGGHFISSRKPKIFNKAVLNFLEEK